MAKIEQLEERELATAYAAVTESRISKHSRSNGIVRLLRCIDKCNALLQGSGKLRGSSELLENKSNSDLAGWGLLQ